MACTGEYARSAGSGDLIMRALGNASEPPIRSSRCRALRPPHAGALAPRSRDHVSESRDGRGSPPPRARGATENPGRDRAAAFPVPPARALLHGGGGGAPPAPPPTPGGAPPPPRGGGPARNRRGHVRTPV